MIVTWPLYLFKAYRRRCCRRAEVMLDHLKKLAPNILLRQDGDVPWLKVYDNPFRFYGFWSGKKELLESRMWREELPFQISGDFLRLVKDYVTRYVYPHMRPDLTPKWIRPENWGGFHGQHKDFFSGEILEAFIPKPDDIILNCGSFIGFGDMHMAPLVPHGHIYSIEAEADNFALLKKNLGYNHIQNVTALHHALWKEETDLDLEIGPAQANTLISEVRKGESVQSVRTITIDGLVKKQKISKLDMVSLTLNGAEIEALEGAVKTLETLRPRIRLPGWYSRDDIPIWELAKNFLEKIGYRVFVAPHGNVLAL